MIASEGLPVEVACRVLDVSCSGFYAWRDRPPSPRAVRHAWLTDVIREVHVASYGTYGAKRVYAELTLGRGIEVGHNAVTMMMQRAGIAGRNGAPKWRGSGTPTAEDLVDRRFRRSRTNELWLTDIRRSRTVRRWKASAASPSQRAGEAGGSLTRETGEGGSSPDNAGTGQHRQMARVRQARRKGVREEPASERLSREYHQLEPDGSGLGSGAHPARARGTPQPVDVAGREATVNACGVAVAMPQGHSWAPTPSNGSRVNVGTIPAVPSPRPAACWPAGRPVAGRCRRDGAEDP